MNSSTAQDGFSKELSTKINQKRFDDVHIANMIDTANSNSPKEALDMVQNSLTAYKESYSRNRNDLSTMMTLDKTAQLGPVVDSLNKRLQDHLRMLRQSETTTKQPNIVLEYDMAKRKADKLAEILRAKMIWDNTYEELQLLDAADIAMRYQKLVALQQSYDILRKYSLDPTKVEYFERMKDEFLSWYSPATILAIDSNDLKQLENIKEKYTSLDRLKAFESNFGNYAKNKIKCFIEDESKQHTLWSILEETFNIWKRCHKIVDSFIEEDGSELVTKNLYEGITLNWDQIQGIVSEMSADYENPFIAAKSIGKLLNDFLEFVEKEGDEHIYEAIDKLSKLLYDVLSKDYGKHVTSMLLQTINKITVPEKGSRHRQNWLLPYLDELQSSMRDIVNEAKNTFGSTFPDHIVPSFEKSIREINSMLQNQNILNTKPEGIDIRMKKSVQENTEDKLSAICITGYLINLVEDINEYIRETASEFPTLHEQPRLISNGSLLETLNLKVVGRKIESIANTIIYPMQEEMEKLKQTRDESEEHSSEANMELSIPLPSFSISPQNYITSVGHGLLSQMNTISAYGNDRNFTRAITSAAADTNTTFNEDEADLWLLTEVAKLVQNAFCTSVGKTSNLNHQLRRQFNADIGFLMDALADLRLQPTAQLTKLADRLKEHSSPAPR